MNEQELRDAMRVAVTAAPPPMTETRVLDAARAGLRRRRATWLGVSSAAVAVVAVVAGMVFVAPRDGEQPTLQIAAEGAARSTETVGSSAATESKETWPSGQTDRTARNGPHFEEGMTVLEKLLGALPAGLTPAGDVNTLYHQAAYEGQAPDGADVWEYLARVPVTRDGGVGFVEVDVDTHDLVPESVCPTPYPAGTCEESQVDGKKIVVLWHEGDPVGVMHRYADGPVVTVGQGRESPDSGQPAMAEPPLTVAELAALAVDETLLPN